MNTNSRTHAPAVPRIAVLPDPPDEILVRAVRDGGGAVGPAEEGTTGVVLSDPTTPVEDLERVLSRNPGIRWVQLPLAGVDRYEPAMDAHPDLMWTSAKGAYAQPVGEFALTLALALVRNIPAFARARSWGSPAGITLHDRDVVIVGAGGVGREILRLISNFTSRTTVVRRTAQPVPGAGRTLTDEGLDEALGQADVVLLAAAMTAGTEHLIDARRLALMRPEAFLINVARGPLVDTDALVQALQAGRLAGAALDVTDPQPLPESHPLWSEPRALVTPHTAETQAMTEPHLAERVRENVARLARGEALEGRVDLQQGY